MTVKKIQRKCERGFNICSDCAYFTNAEVIDEKYPELKRGWCSLHSKMVDNRWETDCKEICLLICEDCTYYKVFQSDYLNDEYEKTICEYWDIDVYDCEYACEKFKQK